PGGLAERALGLGDLGPEVVVQHGPERDGGLAEPLALVDALEEERDALERLVAAGQAGRQAAGDGVVARGGVVPDVLVLDHHSPPSALARSASTFAKPSRMIRSCS